MVYNECMSKTQICAERMRQLRQERGLTTEELADELEISPCSVYYYEHCKHIPNIIMLIKYAIYFGVPADYLLGLGEWAGIHGKWIWGIEDKYQCTNCGKWTCVDEAMDKPMYSFCPYCGAKMD